MSSYGLTKSLNINYTAAQFYIEKYFKNFSSIENYIHNILCQAKSQEYVETIFCRRL